MESVSPESAAVWVPASGDEAALPWHPANDTVMAAVSANAVNNFKCFMIVSSSVYTRYMSRRFCTALGISIMFSPQWQFIVSGLMAAMASSITFPTTGAHSE